MFIFKGDVFENAGDRAFSELDVLKLQKRFIGTVVIRPLREGKVGRSLINPYFVLGEKDTYLRFARYSATIYGMRLYVNAFPFSMQDGETTTCAEITILVLMDYFSRLFHNILFLRADQNQCFCTTVCKTVLHLIVGICHKK